MKRREILAISEETKLACAQGDILTSHKHIVSPNKPG